MDDDTIHRQQGSKWNCKLHHIIQPIIESFPNFTLIWNTIASLTCHGKQIRNVKQDTDDYNKYNSNFNSFNRIKRSCFVRSNDAVESVERHAEYEESTAHGR